MHQNEVVITPVAVEDLRADHSGILIEQIAKLAFEAFREPPWSDDHAHSRLHFGLGVDLMRSNALAFLARQQGSGRVVGYSVGYEVFEVRDDPRDLTLEAIYGRAALNDLFSAGKRVFYWDTLCVDPKHRRRKIVTRFAAASMGKLREQGFSYYVARTDQAALSMRALLAGLGFHELPVHDVRFASRTYWMARL
jgi:ribosomal protein S18 acetylase RimI-like enzyme